MEEKTGPKMVKLLAVAFEPDGTGGYFASGPESGSSVVGWFTRDPKTGQITFGGEVKGTKGGPTCLFLDSEHGFLYAGSWSANSLYVMKTEKKTPAGK